MPSHWINSNILGSYVSVKQMPNSSITVVISIEYSGIGIIADLEGIWNESLAIHAYFHCVASQPTLAIIFPLCKYTT